VLDQELRILRTEQQRLDLLVQDTAAWRDRCEEAQRWLLRGAIIGGEREVRLAVEPVRARLEVTFGGVMGVRYPADAAVELPEPVSSARPPGDTGLLMAVDAYRAALLAAVRHAVADTARRIVAAEVVEVGRRKRAISQRWVPRLEAALHELGQRLDDQERDELVRLHWAAGTRVAGTWVAGTWVAGTRVVGGRDGADR
jgi:vacuolar-type H+-ATPase subunit D/Vma8